jgi:DNA-binding LacI/PurR family transcriptional regulator
MPDISLPTRELVLRTAEELDYQPNPIAQSLVSSQTRIIGVIIPSFTIPFYASAISAIQYAAAQAGYGILVCQSNESYLTEVSNTKMLLNNRVDGLIISLSRETRDFGHFSRLTERQVPVVFFNRVAEELPFAKVVVNDYEGAYQVVEHLISQGCRRIAHIAGPAGLQLVQNRLQGYRDALQHYGLPLDEDLIRYGDLTIENGSLLARQLLAVSTPPDALFAVCDSAAFGAMLTIKQMGLRIPDDVAVAGFTDEPVAAIVEPALTTVAQPIAEIGRAAVALFLQQIERKTNSSPLTRQLTTKLVVRGSSLKMAVEKGYC